MIKAVGRDNCLLLSNKHEGKYKFTKIGIVYVVSYTDGMTKVGRTRDFKTRVGTLSNGRLINNCFCMITDDYCNAELRSLKELSMFNVHGEYFSCSFDRAVKVVESKFKDPKFLSEREIAVLQEESDNKFNKIISSGFDRSNLTSAAVGDIDISHLLLFLNKEFISVTEKLLKLLECKISDCVGFDFDINVDLDACYESTIIDWTIKEREEFEYLSAKQAYLKSKIEAYS